ncbi:MAG TPA: porin family protein [Arachidicoccus sp.]
MRKIAVAFLLFVSTATFAQTSIRFGLEAGPNMTFPYHGMSDNSPSPKAGFGFWGGALMEASLKNPSDNIKLQLEVLYNNLNQKFNETGGYMKWKFQQINMPLMAKFFVSPDFSINLGPTFNFNVAGKSMERDRIDTTITINRGDLTSVQVGATVGLNYYFNNGIFLNARYNPMFGDIATTDASPDFRMHNIQIGIGFRFASFSPDVPGSGY